MKKLQALRSRRKDGDLVRKTLEEFDRGVAEIERATASGPKRLNDRKSQKAKSPKSQSGKSISARCTGPIGFVTFKMTILTWMII